MVIEGKTFKLVHAIWYSSHLRTAKAQTSLHIRAVSSEPSLLAKYDTLKVKFGPRSRTVVPLCNCASQFVVTLHIGFVCWCRILLVLVNWKDSVMFSYRKSGSLNMAFFLLNLA